MAAMALALVGCGGGGTPETATPTESQTSTQTSSTSTAAPSPGTSTETTPTQTEATASASTSDPPAETSSAFASPSLLDEFLEDAGYWGKYVTEVEIVDGKVSVYSKLPAADPSWHAAGFSLCSHAVQTFRPEENVVVFAPGPKVMTSAAGPNPMGMDCKDFPRD